MKDTANSYISPQVDKLRIGRVSGGDGFEGLDDSALSGSSPEAGEESAEGGRAEPVQEPCVIPGPSIEQLLQSTKNLWRGGYQEGYAEQDCLSTGFAELDSLLPGGGWPRQGLIEIVNRRPGVGELQLLLPLMRTLIAQGLWVLWIAPPFSPYAPGLAQAGVDLRRVLVVAAQQEQSDGKKNHDAPVLVSEGSMMSKDALWCMERALQTPHCGLVLAWQGQLAQRVLRRLQLAAVTGKAVGALFMKKNSEHSPSSMKLEIKSTAEDGQQYLDINILKARGSFKPSSLRLQLRDLPGASSTAPEEDRKDSRENRERRERRAQRESREGDQDRERGEKKDREIERQGPETQACKTQEPKPKETDKETNEKVRAPKGKSREVVGDA